MDNNNTAKELVLELFKKEHITKDEFMLLFEAINNRGINFPHIQLNPPGVPMFPQPDVTPYPTHPNIWYTTTVPNNIPYGTTSDIPNGIGGIMNNNDNLTKNV
jgi:hypothetical protein